MAPGLSTSALMDIPGSRWTSKETPPQCTIQRTRSMLMRGWTE